MLGWGRPWLRGGSVDFDVVFVVAAGTAFAAVAGTFGADALETLEGANRDDQRGEGVSGQRGTLAMAEEGE